MLTRVAIDFSLHDCEVRFAPNPGYPGRSCILMQSVQELEEKAGVLQGQITYAQFAMFFVYTNVLPCYQAACSTDHVLPSPERI